MVQDPPEGMPRITPSLAHGDRNDRLHDLEGEA
jgi:hypothetical protein